EQGLKDEDLDGAGRRERFVFAVREASRPDIVEAGAGGDAQRHRTDTGRRGRGSRGVGPGSRGTEPSFEGCEARIEIVVGGVHGACRTTMAMVVPDPWDRPIPLGPRDREEPHDERPPPGVRGRASDLCRSTWPEGS